MREIWKLFFILLTVHLIVHNGQTQKWKLCSVNYKYTYSNCPHVNHNLCQMSAPSETFSSVYVKYDAHNDLCLRWIFSFRQIQFIVASEMIGINQKTKADGK